MVSPITWVKTLFHNPATRDISMSKVGVLFMAVTDASVIAWFAYKLRDLPIVMACAMGALTGLFLWNRVHSRSIKASISKEKGISMEQELVEPEKDRQ